MLNRIRSTGFVPVVVLAFGCSGGGGESQQTTSAENPCAAAAANPCNPCAANPCAENPCNPCAAAAQDIDADKIVQPEGVSLASGGMSDAELIATGERLWNDKSLSAAGNVACSTCHANKYGMMNATFAEPYPHRVKMAKQRAGIDQVNAAEMVQLCMVAPMSAEPLDWNDTRLTALTAYVESIQEGFDASMAATNPCNPCAANPCNPCAANPCNPCGTTP